MIGIKSKNIMKKIFKNLNEFKLLNIIRNSKKFQSLLDITIDDYKLAYKEYCKIEIEITLSEDEDLNKLDLNKFNEKIKKNPYFHLEKKKDDFENKYIIKLDTEIESLESLFDGYISIKEINFIKFNRKDIKNMSKIFNLCINLIKVDLSKIRTNNVEDMSSMFASCLLLENLNLSNFNTSKVINMSHMFYICNNLQELNISSFNTSNVTSMQFMFYFRRIKYFKF